MTDFIAADRLSRKMVSGRGCRVGKIAWHCDDYCTEPRNFAHALLGHAGPRGQRAGTPYDVNQGCGTGALPTLQIVNHD
jgi:hypothetical protein